MTGFEAAYAGRSLAGLPPELADALARFGGQSVTLGLRQGKPEAVAEALGLLADERADRAKQLQYLQVLGEVARAGEPCRCCFSSACHSPDNALRAAALAALAELRRPGHRRARCSRRYGNLSDDVLAAAQNLLVGRRAWALAFLEAIDARTIDPRTVPARDRREARPPGRPANRPALTRALRARSEAGDVGRAPGADRPAGGVVRAGPGVPKPGRQIFVDQCARCHALFGKGGKVGPDLTTYRRDDLDDMLLNIVNPSAEIREGYTGYVVATTDGRTLTGVVVEQDKNVVVLRGSDGKELTLSPGRHRGDEAQPRPRSCPRACSRT